MDYMWLKLLSSDFLKITRATYEPVVLIIRFFRHSGECVQCALHMRLDNAGCHRLLGSDKVTLLYAIGAYVFFRGDTAPMGYY